MLSYKKILFASLVAGGLEVLWITIYSSFTDITISQIGREISFTLFPYLTTSNTLIAVLGLIIHMLLSVILVFAYVYFVWRPITFAFKPSVNISIGIIVLSLVWYLNFYIVLPYVNVSFTLILPQLISLFSKILFGIGMTSILQWDSCKHNKLVKQE